MNNETGYDKAKRLTGPQKDAMRVNNFYETRERIDTLEGRSDKYGDINKYTADFKTAIESMTQMLSEISDSRTYKKVADLIQSLSNLNSEVEQSERDYKRRAVAMAKADKLMSEAAETGSKELRDLVKTFSDSNKTMIETSEMLSKRVKDEMLTLGQAIEKYSKDLGEGIRKISNFMNLNKLVTNGTGLSAEQLRDMQHEVKVELGLNTTKFLDTQRSLIEQNVSDLGMTFADSVAYMKSIKEYNMKNAAQATALYKQVTLGTRYLGLSNTNIANMTKAVNQMGDNSFMERQLALLTALGNDSRLNMDVNSLADFIGENMSSVATRYRNGEDLMKGSLVIKGVSNTLFGSDSKLVENLMAEIMSVSDFSQLSDSTQKLLSYTGQASNVWQQIRSGNADMYSIVSGVLQGTSNLEQYQRTTLENIGLGGWVTAGGTYQRNAQEWNNQVDYFKNKLDNIDLSNAEELELALAQDHNDKTFYEKITDSFYKFIGFQNKNWASILGISQTLGTLANAIVIYNNIFQSGYLKSILAAILTKGGSGGGGVDNFFTRKALGTGTSWLGSTSLGAKTIGGAAMTNGVALAGGGLIAGGVIKGISDAVNMQGSTGQGWLADSARGFFLGTGSTSNENNTGSSLGNTAKWAAIGAGIGTFIAPGLGTAIGGVVGGAAGLLASLYGNSLDDNRKAIEDNTKALRTNNSIYNNSDIANYIRNSSGGAGMGGDNIGGYPWRITSPFGMRTTIKNGKKVTDGSTSMHYGIDFKASSGTPIGAAMGGKVIYANYAGSAGNMTKILGDDGWTYKYMHQVRKPPVSVGQRVEAGDIIGYVGTTGNSTGNHLHFQVDKGTNKSAVNPLPFVTGGLFSPAGYSWSRPQTDSASATENDKIGPNMVYSLSKESLFNVGGATDDSSTLVESPKNAYATSSDVNRLIEVIKSMRDEQNEQRELMQTLAGKNRFVFSN